MNFPNRYILATRVLISADFNTYPIQIFLTLFLSSFLPFLYLAYLHVISCSLLSSGHQQVCVLVCMDVRGCVQMCTNLYGCAQMGAIVCGCTWLCAVVCGCRQLCEGVCGMNFQNTYWRLES